MYIRQMSLFSFEDIIDFQQESKLDMVLGQIDVSCLTSALRKSSDSRGPKGFDPTNMIYSLIAMQVLRINRISELVSQLKVNPVLRYTCGFKVIGRVPSESTFSRFINKISDSSVLEDLFTKLVEKANALKLVDGEHISIDSTKLGSFEASKPKKKIVDDGSNPNWGMKRDTNGNNIRWFGWKLHIICDSKSELPLDILVTPANVYDGTVAVTMIESFLEKFQSRFKPKYYAMDSGYDFEYVYDDIINKFNAIPIIAYNPRGSKSSPEGLDEDFNPLCSGGFKLAYWGKDGDYLKFRCPHATSKINCPHGMNWCSSSNYGYTTKFNYKENPRQYGYPLRGGVQWQLQYNLRTSVERCNSRLKEGLNLDHVRSKGIKKVKTHALLNCIALIAGTIVSNIQREKKKAA